MIHWILDWPTWYLARVFGIVSYMMLFAGIMLGMFYGFPGVKAYWKADIYRLHQFFTNGGVLLALLHAAILVVDTYTPFGWREVLIPFAARTHPVLNGIGTLALYGALLVILTTDLRPKLRKSIWFAIHLLAYPIFLLALAHGLMEGTDSAVPAVRFMYVGTLAATVLLMLARAMRRARSRRRPGALAR